MRFQGKRLNLFRFLIVDLCRTNVFRTAARLRIEKRVLVREIVKAAFWNYFENRQGLITEDTNRQFSAGHKFFYQQFFIVLCDIGHGRIDLAFVFHDHNADGRTLARRLYHNRNWNGRTLT